MKDYNTMAAIAALLILAGFGGLLFTRAALGPRTTGFVGGLAAMWLGVTMLRILTDNQGRK